MWDLPGPGLEPVSPALAGGFLTTAPPGKPEKGDCFYVTDHNHQEKKNKQQKFEVYGKRTSITSLINLGEGGAFV